MPKTRLDVLLVERGLAETRSKAQALIMAGQVRVNAQMVDRAGATFPPEAQVTLDAGPRFVSRGGDKLLAALEAFPVNPAGRTCADVGASTGGFTDCLLQHGATRVYTIDVGKGILHWKLRNDPRVVVMEETNARFVESLPEPVQLVVCDASFISQKILLPMMKKWLTPLRLPPFSEKMGGEPEGGCGDVITLIKPQFEAGRAEVAKGRGVVRDPEIHRKVLVDLLTFAQAQGFSLRGLIRSPLKGPEGNIEFLTWLDLKEISADSAALIEAALT
jgi:23S rRNA (cytidine1920-2'-O)/16S rRNA (cytidine1409-2'-O)-methyltransferase